MIAAMSREGVELVTSVFEHTYTRENYEDVLPLYHPDLIYHPRPEDPEPGVHHGRDAFRELIGGYVDSLTEINFDVLEVIDAGEYVIASTVLKGRGSASGAPVADPYVFVYKLRDGLVVEGWEFKSKAEALALTRTTSKEVSAEKLQQIQASTDALNAEDFDALSEFFHPELEHHSVFGAVDGDVYRGIEGQRKRWANIQETWDEFSIEVVEVHDVGDERAAVVLRLTGKAKESGVPLDSLIGQLWSWRDGTVGRIASYTEPREALKAAGL